MEKQMLTVVIGSFLVLILGYQGAKKDQNEKPWIWWSFAAGTSFIVALTYMGNDAGSLPTYLVGGINALLWCELMTLVGIGLWRSDTVKLLLKKLVECAKLKFKRTD